MSLEKIESKEMKLEDFAEKLMQFAKKQLEGGTSWLIDYSYDGDDKITIDMNGLPGGSSEDQWEKIWGKSQSEEKLHRIKKIIEED